jgi:hypothetical protein
MGGWAASGCSLRAEIVPPSAGPPRDVHRLSGGLAGQAYGMGGESAALVRAAPALRAEGLPSANGNASMRPVAQECGSSAVSESCARAEVESGSECGWNPEA